MDLRALISLLSVMVSAVSNAVVLAAPTSEVPAASLARHVRNKRCSCASFLDKECVYFCHLDIIWVTTPERIVSYGLGDNAPRRRRSVGGDALPPPRCRCVRGHRDSACSNFCQDNQLRYNSETPPSKAILPRAEGEGCSGARCAPAAAARIKRRTNGESVKKTASPVALRAAAKARAVLETWRMRRWRRTEEKEEHVF